MRTVEYAVLTFIAIGLTLLMVTPVAKFINKSFTEAARNLSQQG